MFSAEQHMDLRRVQAAGNVGVLLLTGNSHAQSDTVIEYILSYGTFQSYILSS